MNSLAKTKIVTFSFDDGVLQDKKLIEILDKYNAKCTFNINSGLFSIKSKTTNKGLKVVDYSKFDKEEVSEVYKNHEIGGHGLTHLSLTSISLTDAYEQISIDKHNLEQLIHSDVSIFAYPYGNYNDEIIELLKHAGYKAARTVNSTYDFKLPTNTFELNPTCHYNDPRLMELAEDFISNKDNDLSLFYIWGHSYEFDQYDNYDVIENLLKYLSNYKDEIWFATNGEVIDYIHK